MDTTAPSTVTDVRLHLDPQLSGKGMLDGGWWPRSNDPAAELPALIAALDAQVGTVYRIVLNGKLWEGSPRRITASGHTVRLGWHGPSDINELSVSGAGRDRLDLLVVPPDTNEAVAEASMATAASGANAAHGAAILDDNGAGGASRSAS